MTDFTFIDDNTPLEWPRGPSDIFVQVTEGEDIDFPGFEVDVLGFSDGDANYEMAEGDINHALAGTGFAPEEPGLYIILGFRARYSKDYYGEVDCDFSIESFHKLKKHKHKGVTFYEDDRH